MARRRGFLPLALAVFGVVMYLQSKRTHHHEEHDSESADEAPAARTPGDYALDASRDNWPPLEAQGAPAGAPAQPSDADNYYLVLDASGSMQRSDCSGDQSKIAVAVGALTMFIDSVPKDANLGLAVFGEGGLSERVPLGQGNRDQLKQQLLHVSTNGATPLKSAIELAYSKLTTQARAQLGYGEYHLVVVTDGAPQPDTEDPTPIVGRILTESPVILHTIGFCLDTDHVLNQPGRTLYMAADSPDDLTRGLQSVLAEAPAFDVTQFK